MTALVVADRLSKHYRMGGGFLLGAKKPATLRAVDDVSLKIRAGETLGLVGESGCGKSTLGRLLIRLLDPTQGRVLFDGIDITALDARELRARRRGMQIVFQDPYGALDPRLCVEDIVMEPLLIHGARADGPTRAAVARMIDLVGLPSGAGERFPHEFSGGQRQRVGIARALILRPKFVVCDEPVSALDVSVQAQIVNLLQDLQGEFGLTYLFIAHDLAVVKHISDRVAVMYLGRVVEIADKATLYAAPVHPYTRALIASVPAARPAGRETRRAARAHLSGELPSALDPPAGCRFHTRCPHAVARCRTDVPVLAAINDPGRGAEHAAACHLAERFKNAPGHA